VVPRDREGKHHAIDAHGVNALFPLAGFLEPFLQATEAGGCVKGQKSVLDLGGTMGKMSRVIVTARAETEQNTNLFLFIPSPHICTLHF